MKRLLFVVVPAVLVLGSFVTVISAQTGPTGPVSGTPKVAPAAQKTVAASPELLAEFLRGEGYQVQIRDIQGTTDKMVVATVVRDGWNFVLEFEYMHKNSRVNLNCPLGNANPQYSAAQWRALLERSFAMPVPMHFSFRASDQRLMLENPLHATANMPAEYVRSIINQMITTARDTHGLWGNPAGQAAANQPAPAAPATPKSNAVSATPASPAANVQAAPKDLASTTWIGSETLQGYGRLEFRFHANGKVTMIDAEGQTEGVYTLSNGKLTLTFDNGGVVYSGVINGTTINGTAQNKESTWSFSVVKR